ncbi:MAG: hypothetical protein M3N34_03820 [Pseudomonadota bacterium]|nr:hypothetical protein [Pseudomonadota bacterium]
MTIWRNINPAGAIGDFIAVWRGAGRMRWRFMLLAIAVSGTLFSMVVSEEDRIEPRPPEIIYITSWHANRSEAEILASNAANHIRQKQLAAEQAKRELEVKNIYKALGRASGMDVDAIDRQAQAEQAASAAAAARSATPKSL